MTALDALARARAAELTLTAAGDRLRWRGPQPAPDLLAALRAHKAELLTLLAENERGELADALLASAERGAATLAAGPADPIKAAERAAIHAEADQPAPVPADRHREHVQALRHAALLRRPPSWADPAAPPSPGSRCSCCRGGRWWTERIDPTGWRCWTCHPGEHLPAEQRREVRT